MCCIAQYSFVIDGTGSTLLFVISFQLTQLRDRARRASLLLRGLRDRLAQASSLLAARGGLDDRISLATGPGETRNVDLDAVRLPNGSEVGLDLTERLASFSSTDDEGTPNPTGHRSASEDRAVRNSRLRSRSSGGNRV